MGPVSIGVEVQRNTNGGTPSNIRISRNLRDFNLLCKRGFKVCLFFIDDLPLFAILKAETGNCRNFILHEIYIAY